MRFLLAGESPYATDYRETPLADWPYDEGGLTVHPALSHYPYLPLTFLLPLPIQWLSEEFLSWFDQRVVDLLFFAGTLWLAWRLSRNPVNKRLLLIVFGLNPLLVIFLTEGRNDILSLFWVLATIRLLQAGRIDWSAVTMALACATKQFAWLFLPFYFAWLAGTSISDLKRVYLRLKTPQVIFAIVLACIFLPWLLWDAPAFLEDILAYQSGVSAGGYPLGGFSAGSLLLSLGIIHPETKFPFVLLQVFLGIHLLFLLISRMRSQGSLRFVLAGYGLWLFVMLFLARSFTDNYLGFVISIMTVAAFCDQTTADR